jgi:hypothetical protein
MKVFCLYHCLGACRHKWFSIGPITTVEPLRLQVTLKGFVAAIIGGFQSRGYLGRRSMLGLIENFASLFTLSISRYDLFLVIIAVLIFRPSGLFESKKFGKLSLMMKTSSFLVICVLPVWTHCLRSPFSLVRQGSLFLGSGANGLLRYRDAGPQHFSCLHRPGISCLIRTMAVGACTTALLSTKLGFPLGDLPLCFGKWSARVCAWR